MIFPIFRNHAALVNLPYADSGHTGFAGRDVTNTFSESQQIAPTGETVPLTLVSVNASPVLVGYNDTGALQQVFDVSSGGTVTAVRYVSRTLSVVNQVAGTVPAVVTGAASQSANLQEWRDSASAVVASVSPAGVITGVGTGLTGVAKTGSANTFSAANVFTGTYAENTTTQGIHLGITGGSPRVLWCDGTAANNFQIDQASGRVRLLFPGVEMWRIYNTTSPKMTEISDDLVVGSADGTASPARLYARTSGAATPVVMVGHDTQTPTAPELAFQLFSSTNTRRTTFGVNNTWATSTDATRKARTVFNVYDTAAREAMRMETDGSQGYAILKAHTTAPGDAMLPNGSVAFYDNGSGSLAIKLKDAGGTVRTGTVTLT